MNTNQELREVYTDCYSNEHYKMGHPRRQAMLDAIGNEYRRREPQSLSVLDVGCGRGELLHDIPLVAPFHRVKGRRGREIVPDLCGEFDGWGVDLIESVASMPTNVQYDIVCCSDVLEHILPIETNEALRRLWACTRQALVVNVAWFPHTWTLRDGRRVDLHINKLNAEEWRSRLLELPQLVVGTMMVGYSDCTARIVCWRHP